MNGLEWFETILRITYLVVMILIIVFIVWILVKPSNNDNDEVVVVNNDFNELPSGKVKPVNRTFSDPPDIDLELSTDPSPDSTLSYTEFKKIVVRQQFVEAFEKALRKSFYDKREIYIKRQHQVAKDIRAKMNKSSLTSFMEHDIALTRLKSLNGEYLSIVKAIDQRLNDLNYESVRAGLMSAVFDPYMGIESVVGRSDTKDFLSLQLYSFSQNPRTFYTNFQNIVILGPTGVGKTKLAQTIGYVFATSGILVRNKFRSITKNELTTAYINESASLTRDALMSTLEGILFLDEAYDIVPDKVLGQKVHDHGSEAVSEMVNFLDKNVGLSIVVAAGYEKDMRARFLGANDGMPRRFPHIIKLTGYDAEQLTNLLLTFLAQKSPDLIFCDKEANFLYALIKFLLESKPKIFSKHAGDMLNLSGSISRAIYGSKDYVWDNSSSSTNMKLLVKGFNDYLRQMDLSVKIPDNF